MRGVHARTAGRDEDNSRSQSKTGAFGSAQRSAELFGILVTYAPRFRLQELHGGIDRQLICACRVCMEQSIGLRERSEGKRSSPLVTEAEISAQYSLPPVLGLDRRIGVTGLDMPTLHSVSC
eukprot:1145956-Pelagomonas_calceolata.AAC.1